MSKGEFLDLIKDISDDAEIFIENRSLGILDALLSISIKEEEIQIILHNWID